METEAPRTGETTTNHVGAGVPTGPAEQSSAGFFCQAQAAVWGGHSCPPPLNLEATRVWVEETFLCGMPGRGRPGLRVMCILTIVALAFAIASAQTTGKTVRHHKVQVEDPSSPPELLQAE